MDLEGFFITMATVVNVPQIWLCHDALMPTLGMCVRFRQDPSVIFLNSDISENVSKFCLLPIKEPLGETCSTFQPQCVCFLRLKLPDIPSHSNFCLFADTLLFVLQIEEPPTTV